MNITSTIHLYNSFIILILFSSFFRMGLALKLRLENMSTELTLTKMGIVSRFMCAMQMSSGTLFAGKTCALC